MYDAVYLYALAVNACLADGWPPENSSHAMKYLTNREFQGTQLQYYLKQNVQYCIAQKRDDVRKLDLFCLLHEWIL